MKKRDIISLGILGVVLAISSKFLNIYITCGFIIFAITGTILIMEKEKKKYNNVEKEKQELMMDILEAVTWEWNIEEGKVAFSKEYLENIKKDRLYEDKEVLKFIKRDERKKVEEYFSKIKKERTVGKYEIVLTIVNKEKEIPIRVLFKVFDKNIKVIGGIIIDLTRKREQEKKIKDSEKIYKLAIQGSRDILFYWNIGINLITLKGKISNFIEVCEEESLKLEFEEFVSYIHRDDKKKILEMYNKCLNGEDNFFDIEFRFKNAIDEDIWFSLRGRSFKEDEDVYIYGSLSNINDRKEKEEKINFIRYYDEITGIPNRRMFKEKVSEIIDDARRDYRNLAIIFIDLDNFKYINDTYGHEVGDKVLKYIAETLGMLQTKNSFIARFGGDEFVIVVDKIESFDELEKQLSEIILKCNTSCSIDEKDIYCSVSIGVSIFGKDGMSLENLMKSADLAMYTAKESGKNRYAFFNDEILKKINRELEIKEGLRKAMLNKELYGVLQPKYLSKSEKIIGFEYLVRWKSKSLGFVPPMEFIKIAENTGQIVQIGKYIIRDAIRMCKMLTEYINEDFKIAINLSEVQLKDPGIVDFIKNEIKVTGVNPKNLELEITESIIMESAEKNISILKRLKEIGVTIALDDFGTGYSSLSYLRVLPIDILKIDKSFIDYINKDKKSEYIIETIIELSHCFNFLVVAEGVEERDQFEYLKKNKCDIIQGYYFSKPLEFNDVLKLIEKEEVKMLF
ncbi:MAG: sensor domain-containing protein [Clostridium sp.]|uniref:sensor domain-containing protein n=1 Tax=Clostridium sp. TaxID=1506 RepID=UPI003F3FFE0F